MNMLRAMGCALALAAGLCAGCAGESRAPSKPVQTSYPSPDYLPQDAATPAPAAPASAPQDRPLYGPVGQAAPAATAPAAAATAPVAAPAAPQEAPGMGRRPVGAPNMNRLFDAMDADHNGRVTLEEWRNFHEREFRRLDKNDDGVLTREEMAAPPPQRPGGPRPAP